MAGARRTPAGASFDAATRGHALVLADEIGYKAAAAQIGCSPSSIRSWRHRAAVRDGAAGPSRSPGPASGLLSPSPGRQGDRTGHGHEARDTLAEAAQAGPADLHRLADEARHDAATARQRMHEALQAGHAQNARALGQLQREAI